MSDTSAVTDPKYYEVVEATWPAAAKRNLGPVTLRDGQGGGSRVSAASVEGKATEAEVAAAEEAMRAAGRRPLFMIRDGQDDLDARLDARYNAGNAAYGAGRLEDSVEDWQRVLEQDPEHAPAQKNLQAVQQELARRMTPPDEQQQDQDQNSENQDPGEQEQEQQEGDQEQGDTGGGESESEQGDTGEEQEGEPQDQESQDDEGQGEPDGGEREEQEDGEELDEDDLAQADASEGEDTGEPAEGQAPLQEGVGEMSDEEAQRLLEGAEEGRPRVVVRGTPSGKDW